MGRVLSKSGVNEASTLLVIMMIMALMATTARFNLCLFERPADKETT